MDKRPARRASTLLVGKPSRKRERQSETLPTDGPEDSADPALRQLVHDFMSFGARMQENRARIAASVGLTGQQYTILLTIAHHQHLDGYGIIQVADHLRLSGAFVTLEVNKLVAGGLVRKKSNPVDRRRVLLTTTLKAQRLLEKLSQIQKPSNDTIFGGLSDADLLALRRIIPKLVETSEQSLKLVELLTSRRAETRGGR